MNEGLELELELETGCKWLVKRGTKCTKVIYVNVNQIVAVKQKQENDKFF